MDPDPIHINPVRTRIHFEAIAIRAIHLERWFRSGFDPAWPVKSEFTCGCVVISHDKRVQQRRRTWSGGKRGALERTTYLACPQPLYGQKRRGLWWGWGELRTYKVSWIWWGGTRQSLKRLPRPSIANHGYHRTWQQCKTKIKNMTSTIYK